MLVSAAFVDSNAFYINFTLLVFSLIAEPDKNNALIHFIDPGRMSQIRKRSLKATFWIYFGFLIGAVNTYFLTHKNWFSTDQNGLTRAMIEISQLIFAFSSLGTTSFLFKFFPYYHDNLENRKNDLLGTALKISLIGFVITAASLYFLQPLIIRKFSANSLLLVEYFFWIIPMGFAVLLYSLLETYSYGFNKGVLTSLLKETILRMYTLVIIVCKVMGWIDFSVFIKLFSLQYGIIFLVLAIHLKRENQLWLQFSRSRLTFRYRKKILAITSLTFIVIVVSVLRQSIDGLVLAAKQNLGKVGIFGLASYMVSVLQAPFRSLVAVTIPVLSRAWKDKNLPEINRIYHRSSINLLSFALLGFGCIWLNYTNGILYFGINPDYLEGKWVFFLLGLVTLIETGTGVNAQIIGTSTYWRFELWTSLLLTALLIPLSYTLTVRYGIIGPAIANLISFSVYNAVRIYFLWNKYRMQPFSGKTVEVLFIACIAFVVSAWVEQWLEGLMAMIVSVLLYAGLFVGGMWWRNISPDLQPVFQNLRKRFTRSAD